MVVIYRCYYKDVALYFPAIVVNKTPTVLIHMFFFLLVISFRVDEVSRLKKLFLDRPLGFKEFRISSYTSCYWINHARHHACTLIPGVFAVVFLDVRCTRCNYMLA
uniref:Uncharacterized protein n=1 Tax=Triticum urartu TaxID=4572 RepID=A0A8R7K117_TRIUA